MYAASLLHSVLGWRLAETARFRLGGRESDELDVDSGDYNADLYSVVGRYEWEEDSRLVAE